MLPGKKYTPEEILRVARRHWCLILLPALVGTASGVLAYGRMPREYRSETLIEIVPPDVPHQHLSSPVASTSDDRLTSVNEQILTRFKLHEIISEFELHKARRVDGTLDDVVQRLRDDIQVRLEGKDVLRISYKNADQRTAQKVTERLASLYMEGNLRDRENLPENTSNVHDLELEDVKRQLMEQESKIEEHRRRYAEQLPSAVAGNLRAIQTAQLQLQAAGESQPRGEYRV